MVQEIIWSTFVVTLDQVSLPVWGAFLFPPTPKGELKRKIATKALRLEEARSNKYEI